MNKTLSSFKKGSDIFLGKNVKKIKSNIDFHEAKRGMYSSSIKGYKNDLINSNRNKEELTKEYLKMDKNRRPSQDILNDIINEKLFENKTKTRLHSAKNGFGNNNKTLLELNSDLTREKSKTRNARIGVGIGTGALATGIYGGVKMHNKEKTASEACFEKIARSQEQQTLSSITNSALMGMDGDMMDSIIENGQWDDCSDYIENKVKNHPRFNDAIEEYNFNEGRGKVKSMLSLPVGLGITGAGIYAGKKLGMAKSLGFTGAMGGLVASHSLNEKKRNKKVGPYRREVSNAIANDMQSHITSKFNNTNNEKKACYIDAIFEKVAEMSGDEAIQEYLDMSSEEEKQVRQQLKGDALVDLIQTNPGLYKHIYNQGAELLTYMDMERQMLMSDNYELAMSEKRRNMLRDKTYSKAAIPTAAGLAALGGAATKLARGKIAPGLVAGAALGTGAAMGLNSLKRNREFGPKEEKYAPELIREVNTHINDAWTK